MELTKTKFAKHINVILVSLNVVPAASTNSTEVLPVVCLKHDTTVELIVDFEAEEHIWRHLRGFNRVEIWSTVHPGQIFSIICLQHYSAIGLTVDCKVTVHIWGRLEGLDRVISGTTIYSGQIFPVVGL